MPAAILLAMRAGLVAWPTLSGASEALRDRAAGSIRLLEVGRDSGWEIGPTDSNRTRAFQTAQLLRNRLWSTAVGEQTTVTQRGNSYDNEHNEAADRDGHLSHRRG